MLSIAIAVLAGLTLLIAGACIHSGSNATLRKLWTCMRMPVDDPDFPTEKQFRSAYRKQFVGPLLLVSGAVLIGMALFVPSFGI